MLFQKSRVHWYKPIQVAEILYRHRIGELTDLLDLEQYRSPSKRWRDDITLPLLGRVCTSSSRFQDNLFDDNAIPPRTLAVLGEANVNTSGAVEAYIYNRFLGRHLQLSKALDLCLQSTRESFRVDEFMNMFIQEAGLRRSMDKIYEIVVYSLFSTLVEAVEMTVEIRIKPEKLPILSDFDDFSQKVLCLENGLPRSIHKARVFRLGATNAADRGLDMYSSWALAIQVKHLSLDEKTAENIVSDIASDRIIIVCKEAERGVILSLLGQIGWQSRIQSVITETDLTKWYDRALRGKHSEILGESLMRTLSQEIENEFPSLSAMPKSVKERHYEAVSFDFWK